MALPSWTSEQIKNQLMTGSRWYSDLITYGFALSSSDISGPSGETRTFRPLSADQQKMTSLAMTTWDDLIAPSLVQTASSFDIALGLSSSNTSYAHSYFPPNGSIWFNASDNGLTFPQVGRYSFETYVHEIGHALGLDHMGNYNGAGNNTPSCYEDSTVYTTMSYFGPDHRSGLGQVAWADWTGANGVLYSPQTPMLSDVQTVQFIYGADLTTRTGNTVYGFNSNVTGSMASILDFTKNANPILTIYDAGGTDTLDFSGWNTSSEINLGAGQFSSCNEMTSNVAIAYGCAIENARGGGGADTITANALSNLLQGNGGNDALKGGGGLDWALYRGPLAGYKLELSAAATTVTDQAAGRDGVDRLTDIERLRFSDLEVGLDVEGVAGQCYRLYKAAFDRAPDLEGLGYWINRMDHQTTLDQVASMFVASDEFAARYGANVSDAAFVNLLYNHVLHRDPDQPGYDYWMGSLAGGSGRFAVLEAFSESKENHAQVADLVAQGIQYKAWVG